jgi:hypothetical protein
MELELPEGMTHEKLKSACGIPALVQLYTRLVQHLETKDSKNIKAAEHLNKAIRRLEDLASHIRELSERIGSLSDNMQFAPLFDRKRQLFSMVSMWKRGISASHITICWHQKPDRQAILL